MCDAKNFIRICFFIFLGVKCPNVRSSYSVLGNYTRWVSIEKFSPICLFKLQKFVLRQYSISTPVTLLPKNPYGFDRLSYGSCHFLGALNYLLLCFQLSIGSHGPLGCLKELTSVLAITYFGGCLFLLNFGQRFPHS